MTPSAGSARTRTLVRSVFWIVVSATVLAVASIVLDLVLRGYLEIIVGLHGLFG